MDDEMKCTKCDKPTKSIHNKMCATHCEYYNNRTKKHRQKLIQLGLCARCGNKNLRIGFKDCFTCKEKRNQQWRVRFKKRNESGMCSACRNPVVGRSPYCEIHHAGSTASKHISVGLGDFILGLYKDSPYCYLCGESIALGVNAQMDHKLPMAKFPELSKHYLNLSWSCATCNLAKRDKTPKQFVEMCMKVVRRVSP